MNVYIEKCKAREGKAARQIPVVEYDGGPRYVLDLGAGPGL